MRFCVYFPDVDSRFVPRPTDDAAQSELPASHPLYQPHPQQGEQEVGQRGQSGQPDRQPVVADARHLEDGGAVIPSGQRLKVTEDKHFTTVLE